MIFLAVGTQKFQFNRLIKMVDDFALESGEEIVAQIGYSDYEPKNIQYFRFMDKEQFDNYIEKCEIFITHAGVGSILNGLEKKKRIIACPRLRKYGEHVDDHQLELTRKFSELGYIVVCNEGDKISDLVKISKIKKFNIYFGDNKNLILNLENYIDNIGRGIKK